MSPDDLLCLRPGVKITHREGGSETIQHRKDDDSGWWLTGGGGIADAAALMPEWQIGVVVGISDLTAALNGLADEGASDRLWAPVYEAHRLLAASTEEPKQ